MEVMEIYWILKLDDIALILFLISTITGVCGFVMWTGNVDYDDYNSSRERMRKKLFKKGKKFISISVVFLVLVVGMPSTKQYLTMVGGNFLTTNDKVITTTEKGFELLDQYLDDKLGNKIDED